MLSSLLGNNAPVFALRYTGARGGRDGRAASPFHEYVAVQDHHAPAAAAGMGGRAALIAFTARHQAGLVARRIRTTNSRALLARSDVLADTVVLYAGGQPPRRAAAAPQQLLPPVRRSDLSVDLMELREMRAMASLNQMDLCLVDRVCAPGGAGTRGPLSVAGAGARAEAEAEALHLKVAFMRCPTPDVYAQRFHLQLLLRADVPDYKLASELTYMHSLLPGPLRDTICEVMGGVSQPVISFFRDQHHDTGEEDGTGEDEDDDKDGNEASHADEGEGEGEDDDGDEGGGIYVRAARA